MLQAQLPHAQLAIYLSTYLTICVGFELPLQVYMYYICRCTSLALVGLVEQRSLTGTRKLVFLRVFGFREPAKDVCFDEGSLGRDTCGLAASLHFSTVLMATASTQVPSCGYSDSIVFEPLK